MKRSDLAFVAIVILVFLCGVVIWGMKQFDTHPYNSTVDVPVSERPIWTLSLNGTPIHAEVVYLGPDTTRGLGGRTQLPRDHGMLFEMEYEGIHSFWMKDTLIPLDIIWIRGDKVVEIVTLQPPKNTFEIPETHEPSATANRVLEINAGVAAAAGLKVGDTIGGIDTASSLY